MSPQISFCHRAQRGRLDTRLGIIAALLLGLTSAGYAFYQSTLPTYEGPMATPDRGERVDKPHPQSPSKERSTVVENSAAGRAGQVSGETAQGMDTAGSNVAPQRAAALALEGLKGQQHKTAAGGADEPDQARGRVVAQTNEADMPPVSEPVAARAMADDVIRITNVGDRIVVSNDPTGIIAEETTQPIRNTNSGASQDDTGTAETTDESVANQPSPYDELYPGCPRELPQGADERMAAERQQLYGCRYLQACLTATEVADASCTWYLVGKT